MLSRPEDVWAVIYTPLQELKAETTDSPDVPWLDRRGRFLEKLGITDPARQPAVGELVQYLDELPEEQRDALLRTDELDQMTYTLVQRHASTGHQPEPAAQPYDEAEWASYLAENGTAWNGAEDTWQQFRDWFAYHAAERGVGAPANELLTYLDGHSTAERITLFANYGVTVGAVQTEVEEEVSTRPNGGGGTRGQKRTREPVKEADKKGPADSGGSGGVSTSRRDGETGEPPRKSLRVAKREAALGPPTLTFTSNYAGVPTQVLNTAQAIYFHQDAVLTKPVGAPNAVTFYYELRQQVRDSWHMQSGAAQAAGPWAQDGPYQPNYGGAAGMITIGANSIQFADDPGFSTVSMVAAGQWLLDYDVWFRWTVTRINDGRVWTSPSVHHSMTSPYAGGANAAVNANAAGNRVWQVNF